MTTIKGALLIIGESLIDRVINDGVEVEYVGGSPANVALGLGRLGHPATLLTQFGADRRGKAIQQHLDTEVTVVQCGPAGAHTSTALVSLDSKGIPGYVFDLSWDVTILDSAPPDLVHTGSLGAYLDPGHNEVVRVVEQHADHATITFDPNLRPLIMERTLAQSRVDRFAALADVIKVSDEDLAWLYPGTTPESIVEQWLSVGVKLVALTRGAQGSEAWTGHAHASTEALRGQVVDTVGAGDAFMSGLIDGLCTLNLTGPAPAIDIIDLDALQLEVLLKHSALSAGIAVQHAGAHPPTRAELGWCQ